MKSSLSGLFVLLLIILFSSTVQAQKPDSVFAGLRAKIGIIQDSLAPPVVFMHIDKSVYPVTEDIWFSAYLINKVDLSACHTLYVALINDMTLKAVSSQRFILDDGISSGNILIPDSLKGGVYSLIAYTNKDLDKPVHHFFRQPITIIGGKKPPFELQFVYPPAEKIINDTVLIACKVITGYGGIAAGGKINYTLYGGDKAIRNASAKLDAFGEVKLPLSLQDLIAFPELRGTVIRDKDTMIFRSSVAGASEYAVAAFYPEAGRLLDGVATNIAFNIRSTNGRGIAVQAGLYKNDTLLQLTESDKFGMGSFSFVPAAGDKYQLKPVAANTANLVILQNFPAVASAGYSINMNSGIATDSLRLYLSTPAPGTDCMIMVHTNSEVFWELMVKVKSRLGRLALPVEGWSKGPATMSVFSARGELVAQKAVMIGMPALTKIDLRTDSLKYHPRSKIKVSLVVSDRDGKPLRALLSAATVLKKTLNNSSVEIDDYQYAGYYSGQRLPITENILETPGKTSQLFLRMSPATVPAMKIKHSAWDGEVTIRDKKLTKPVEVLVTGTSVNILKTDETGNLVIPHDLLRGPSQSKVLIAVVDKRAEYHAIHIPEKDKDLNDSLAAWYVSQPFIMKDELSAREKEEIRLLQGQELATVVVKAKTQAEFTLGSNDCLDYVCSYKILNCSNHLRGSMGTRAATDGETYIVNGVPTVYHCKPILPKHIASINATWDGYQFPPMNPADSTIPPEILKRTTLHWEPHISTGDDGKAEFSFYANDLKGNFVIRIQGVSSNGPVTGLAEFSIAD